jgi:hypothetical protein
MIMNPMSTCLEIVHGCAHSCAEKRQKTSRSLSSRGFCFKWPLTGQFLDFCHCFLALDPPTDYESNEHLFGNCPWVCTEEILK